MKNIDLPKQIGFADFLKVGIYVGTIVKAYENKKAIKSAYILEIDFGEYGIKISSAQITQNYQVEDLIGQQIISVLNFSTKNIAGTKSECLVLAAVYDVNNAVLLQPKQFVRNGTRVL